MAGLQLYHLHQVVELKAVKIRHASMHLITGQQV